MIPAIYLPLAKEKKTLLVSFQYVVDLVTDFDGHIVNAPGILLLYFELNLIASLGIHLPRQIWMFILHFLKHIVNDFNFLLL